MLTNFFQFDLRLPISAGFERFPFFGLGTALETTSGTLLATLTFHQCRRPQSFVLNLAEWAREWALPLAVQSVHEEHPV